MKGKPRTFFYVYILKDRNNKLYIGSTNDLERRLDEYEAGKVFSSKNLQDPELIYYEAYNFEHSARMREKRLKYFGKAYQELKKRIEGGLEGAG